jgi:hypothetical protein
MSDTSKIGIADLISAHAHIASQLDMRVTNQNDWRFALFGALAEIGEVLQILPWRPWRAADDRLPGSVELDEAIPELADVVSAVFRAVANLGIDPRRFELACFEHVQVKHKRLLAGQDR